MAVIPDKYLDLLGHKKAFAALATVMRDGSPQVTPVWFDYEGGLIPDKYLDLLGHKKAFAALATVMRDGSPQAPVWFDYEGGLIRVNTAKGRTKARNMTDGAAVALSIVDPENPYRYLQVRGRVRHSTEAGADQHIDTLAMKYLGAKYPYAQAGDVRIMYEIEPTAASGMG